MGNGGFGICWASVRVEADHATVRDTLQRIVAEVEVKKEGERFIFAFPYVVSVGTPGATRTPAHGSGGRRSIH